MAAEEKPEDAIEIAQMEMEEAVNAFRHELSRVRTGRASTALLEGLHVNYYGARTPLRQLAGLAAPEPRLLVVTPYDKGALHEIEKAIQTSDLGLTPINDGKLIRVPIPELTEQRRKELVRHVHKTAEEFRVSVRNHRRDANDKLKKMHKDKKLDDDDVTRRRNPGPAAYDRAHREDRQGSGGQGSRDNGGLSPPQASRAGGRRRRLIQSVASSLPLNEFPGLSLQAERLPRHVAIVMDGNGRWARQHGLSRSEGHRRGKDSVRAVVEAAREVGIPYLTLFVFSNENWHRPGTEVRFLMELFHRYLSTETKRLMKRDIKVVALGISNACRRRSGARSTR